MARAHPAQPDEESFRSTSDSKTIFPPSPRAIKWYTAPGYSCQNARGTPTSLPGYAAEAIRLLKCASRPHSPRPHSPTPKTARNSVSELRTGRGSLHPINPAQKAPRAIVPSPGTSPPGNGTFLSGFLLAPRHHRAWDWIPVFDTAVSGRTSKDSLRLKAFSMHIIDRTQSPDLTSKRIVSTGLCFLCCSEEMLPARQNCCLQWSSGSSAFV